MPTLPSQYAQLPSRQYRWSNVFFTVVIHQRQQILRDDDVRQALREGIERVKELYPFVIDAWVLLPDHIHAIWTLPEGDADFGTRWGKIKRQVTLQCGERF